MRGPASLALLLALAAPAVAKSPPPTAASLEQRLQRAEDELAIRRILVDYHWNMDNRDFTAYAALFAQNGEWTSGNQHHRGPADIRQMMIGIFGKDAEGSANRRSIEITTNPQIEIAGDRATAHSRHLLIWRGDDGRPTPMLAGRYEDELVREGGQWRILRRTDYPVMPNLEEWGQIMRQRNSVK